MSLHSRWSRAEPGAYQATSAAGHVYHVSKGSISADIAAPEWKVTVRAPGADRWEAAGQARTLVKAKAVAQRDCLTREARTAHSPGEDQS